MNGWDGETDTQGDSAVSSKLGGSNWRDEENSDGWRMSLSLPLLSSWFHRDEAPKACIILK